MDKDKLVELAERCEAATGPDAVLDRAILDALHEKWVGRWLLGPAKYRFTASLDAAMSLVPEGYWWRLGKDTDFAWAGMEPWGCAPDDPRHTEAANCRNPALALCGAALRSHALRK